jgi:hypothetical protein
MTDHTAQPSRRPLLRVTTRTAEIIRRCYPGQRPEDVMDRAMRMLATADGKLTPDGRIKRDIRGRVPRQGRRP